MNARIILESSPNAGQKRNCGSTRLAAGFRLTIFYEKRLSGSKKTNRSAHPVTTMRFCGGTPAPASLSEINSWLAKKKNESNFRSNNARVMSDESRHRFHLPVGTATVAHVVVVSNR